MNNPLIAKVTSLQRCVARAKEEHAAAGEGFSTNFSRQDAAMLNVVRACELAIDLANMVVRLRRLGVPQESRDSFRLLEQTGLIERAMAMTMENVVGFRNVAVHSYRELDMTIVEAVITHRLDDLLAFAEKVRKLIGTDD